MAIITIIRAVSGYLSNYITGETQQGSDSCPWVIRGQPGSKFKFTLMDYAVIDGGPVKSGVCSIYGKINETLICGGEHRSHVIFTSIDDVVRVEISNPRPVKEPPYFLFKYENMLAPSGSVFLEKQPDKLVLFCRHDSNNDNNHHNNYHNNKNNYDVNNYNNDFIINRGSAGRNVLNGSLKIVSSNSNDADDDVIGEYKNKNKNNNLWTLTCVGSKWIGKVPNCTHQDDVGGMGGSWGLTGQIFGSSGQVSRNIIAFFIAVIALLVAVVIVVIGVFSIARSRKKSREERRRRDVREKVLGVTSSSSSAILDSLVVQGQLNSNSMANSSIQHLQQLPPPPYHERNTMTNAQREKDYRYHALSKLVSEADFDSAKVSNLMPPKKSHIAMKVAGSYVMPPPPSSSSSSHVSCSSHPLPPASAIQKNILNNINNNNINNNNINNSNINNSSNLTDELSNVDASDGGGSLLVLNFNRPLQQLFPQQQQQLFQQQQFQQQYPTKQLYQHSQFLPLTQQQQQPQEQQQQPLQQQYDEHIYESPKFLHKSYMDVHSTSNE
ncbi:hypothetical protein HELRODRAFT_170702 [Helobdella robusta]|uniref:CUB domain-containing protein n=1 Tax=Helobdella robusta TaxID=6412 RepID=T1F3C0_HELRO|nr:hypothetical protein HELRODRAFT_170702 [Helobdella robusta]ESO07367.1 hypothetical protein HELRODRAFT_170702 [Helobdella robusta]